ncbi:MAG: GntR family transcriptional regulator [Desulfobacterales bacterium]|nr:GntR family transcriptional regulator [Desulfobacterales bacterium]
MYQNLNIPNYFRVYHEMKASILSGEFERGGKIGTIVDLAKTYGVAAETIRRALHLLKLEGLLSMKQGVGTIIPENANLEAILFGNLVIQKKITDALLNSDCTIISSEWIASLPRRIVILYDLKKATSDAKVLKIVHCMKFKSNSRHKVIATHYVTEDIFHHLQMDRSTSPNDIILSICKWMDKTPLTLTESLRPHLCMGKNAELLGLPDGTPVFHHDHFVCDNENNCYYWETLSTANLHTCGHQQNCDPT